MSIDPLELVPLSKFETEKAEALVLLGFPTVLPVMPQILEWMQDLNWPVAQVFQPFLVTIGQPLAPYLRTILAGDDSGWKCSLLSAVVVHSTELAHALRPELERLARNPSSCEEEVDHAAIKILESLGGAMQDA